MCRNPDYYELIKEPIDLTLIEDKVMTGQYKTLEAFEADFLKLFRNVEVRLFWLQCVYMYMYISLCYHCNI